MRKFLFADNGAVSVYLILIIVPIFLFQAVLIDFARIKVAEKETESAVQAAARSVMSSFDSELQKRGLYGMGLTQDGAEQLFGDVFTNNLSAGVATSAFHFANPKAVAGSMRVTPVYALASHVIFEGQVLEDMKLKAPIEYTLEIADKFQKSGVKEPFQLGSQFSKKAAELEKLIAEREDALDEAWHDTETLHTRMNSFHSYYQSRITELNELAARIGIHTVDEVRGEISQVKSELESLSNTIQNMNFTLVSLTQAGPGSIESVNAILAAKGNLEEQASTLSQKLNELESLVQLIIQYTALIASTKLEVAANERELVQLQPAIESNLRLAKQKNDEIRTKLAGSSDASLGANLASNDVFQHISLRGDAYFYEYQTSVASITALFSAFHADVESIYLYTSDHTTIVNKANDAYWTLANDFYGKQSLIEQERMAANEVTASSIKAQKNSIQAVLDQAKQAIGSCSVTDTQSSDSELYSKLASGRF